MSERYIMKKNEIKNVIEKSNKEAEIENIVKKSNREAETKNIVKRSNKEADKRLPNKIEKSRRLKNGNSFKLIRNSLYSAYRLP